MALGDTVLRLSADTSTRGVLRLGFALAPLNDVRGFGADNMKANTAGQVVGAQLNSTTGTTTAYVQGDGGAQAAGTVSAGACTHRGNGYWEYAPAQAETNYAHVTFTFVNTLAAAPATVQIYPSFPQTGDSFARIGAAGVGLTSVALSAAGVQAIWDALTSALTTAGSIGKRIVDYLTGDAFARIGAAGAGLTAIPTVARVTLVDTVTTYTGNTPQTGDAFARVGAAGAGLTALGDTRIAHLDENVSAAKTLTTGERTAVANEVEAQIIDDTDSEKVLLAITNKIASVNPDLGGLSVGAIASAAATAVWAAVTRTLTAGTNIILAKGVGVTGFNDPTAAATASAVRTELATELARLDAATSTRASQTSVDDLPTNAEFTAALDAADDATLAAIAALPTADAATIAAAVRDVSNSAPAAGSLGEAVRGADAKAAVLIDTIGAPAGATVSVDIAQIIERTDRLPDDPADESLIIAATGSLATAIAAIPAPPTVDAIADEVATRDLLANVTKVRGQALTGDGSDATPWGPV